jgi:hypothetical protein
MSRQGVAKRTCDAQSTTEMLRLLEKNRHIQSSIGRKIWVLLRELFQCYALMQIIAIEPASDAERDWANPAMRYTELYEKARQPFLLAARQLQNSLDDDDDVTATMDIFPPPGANLRFWTSSSALLLRQIIEQSPPQLLERDLVHWDRIAAVLNERRSSGGRLRCSAMECCLRYYNVMLVSQEPFSTEEDAIIARYVALDRTQGRYVVLHSAGWDGISREMPKPRGAFQCVQRFVLKLMNARERLVCTKQQCVLLSPLIAAVAAEADLHGMHLGRIASRINSQLKRDYSLISPELVKYFLTCRHLGGVPDVLNGHRAGSAAPERHPLSLRVCAALCVAVRRIGDPFARLEPLSVAEQLQRCVAGLAGVAERRWTDSSRLLSLVCHTSAVFRHREKFPVELCCDVLGVTEQSFADAVVEARRKRPRERWEDFAFEEFGFREMAWACQFAFSAHKKRVTSSVPCSLLAPLRRPLLYSTLEGEKSEL